MSAKGKTAGPASLPNARPVVQPTDELDLGEIRFVEVYSQDDEEASRKEW